MNKIILIGRLVRDPELTKTTNGTSVCKFTLAVDRNFKTKEGQKEADFINCVVWQQRAETIVKYMTKGNPIAIEGSMRVRLYENQEGKKQYITEVNVDNFKFLGSAKKTDDAQVRQRDDAYMSEDTDDTELPFNL